MIFLLQPDLVYRLKENIPLVKGDRNTYYGQSNWTAAGYTYYPFAEKINLTDI